MKISTRVNHPPAVAVPADNRPLVAPIYQSVKFTFDDVAETERQSRGQRDGFQYSRVSNPTLQQLSLTLAQLQGRDDCLLTASGVAAVNLALLALCKQGDHVMLFAEMYQPTRYMIRRLLGRYGVTHTMLSIEDTVGIEQALAAKPTRLVMFESPSNPVLKIADIEAITAAARRHGALTVLDNTFAGFHNHGQFEIDVFVHSLTKYASGHGDVMGGAVIARRELIDRMRQDFIVLGATLDPHTAFLIQRGLKTYALRYERQCANAMHVARFLEGHPQVARVSYPGLTSHPQYQLAQRQMLDAGTIVSVELKEQGGSPAAFANALKLFAISASVGSTESLVQPGQLMKPRDLNESEQQWAAVSDRTMRLSVGIEDAEDLVADLQQALSAV
ncbi:aminotransferase class I/II-fold pyridoxal phosphate-dependent enzyme [Steroidobacter sp. S1-65]|uniref:Aminotransferase class I/II-fold pyridoxal phosphate-dependent enzyme n=1 Tax=Steroidobacter gossypii TaxID=2805490 RepID=A0ABS1X3T8_9GAMM|nr:aminotransferase class I/II-fold pyridoxal phosphate-dependent enzyme [Steroidobacter gossypii]MBM0107875.1 aminotransferase class I/II-fold pyridoxal phosphate-dependent enzyme [Steroidobacter gossypii]